jgi:hydrogenase-1 operon protein HyaE
MAMTAPLIDALTSRHGLPLLDEHGLDAFPGQERHGLLFLAGDPAQHPEALDVAVILPELLRTFSGRLQAAVVAPDAAEAVKQRFGVRRWPALVLLRGGVYVGAIERVRSWDDYLSELSRLLAAAPGRPPGVGVPVPTEATSAGGCH